MHALLRGDNRCDVTAWGQTTLILYCLIALFYYFTCINYLNFLVKTKRMLFSSIQILQRLIGVREGGYAPGKSRHFSMDMGNTEKPVDSLVRSYNKIYIRLCHSCVDFEGRTKCF